MVISVVTDKSSGLQTAPTVPQNENAQTCHNYKGNLMILNTTMPEIPVPMFAVVINKIHDKLNIIPATDNGPGRCTVTSAINAELNPYERTRINLGISITPPCGTIATLAKTKDAGENLWQLCDHRIDIDETGEAVATV